MTELGVALLSASRTFRCGRSGSGVTKPEGFVVSRPRASCDAGLLMPRCVSRASPILADARSPRIHPLRTLRCSEDCPTTVPRPLRTATPRARLSTLTSCSPSRCLRPRSSFDARVRRRSGVSSVVRLPLSRQTSLGSRPSRSRPRAPGRVHLPVPAVLASRRTRATLPSAHSPRAREFVSRFDESRRRSSSFRGSRPHLAPGHRARPRLSTMALAQP
jgi:hypothetical protein